jgi:flagellar basal-body rod protein FlgC
MIQIILMLTRKALSRCPIVDIVREYVDMISASRSYEANLTVVNASKKMASKALEIGR